MSTGDRVQAAALELFAERGFHGVGIRDLAGAAGVSSATLYHYMGTKQDLLAALMRRSLERLVAQGEVVLAASSDPAEQLRGLVAMHVREHAEQRLLTRVVDGEMRALTGPRRQEVLGLRRRYEDLWRATIATGVAEGAFDVVDADLARLALLEMCTGVSRWYAAAGRLALDDLAAAYVAMALDLLGAG